jgi:hypothetical protein
MMIIIIIINMAVNTKIYKPETVQFPIYSNADSQSSRPIPLYCVPGMSFYSYKPCCFSKSPMVSIVKAAMMYTLSSTRYQYGPRDGVSVLDAYRWRQSSHMLIIHILSPIKNYQCPRDGFNG